MLALFDIIQEPRLDDESVLSDAFKAEYIAAFLKPYTPQQNPVFFHTLGFVGSGKSTVLQHYFAEEENTVRIAFDSIMEGLPQYRDDMMAYGAQKAFEKWERIARHIGYHIVQQALAQKLTLAFEHSGARADHVHLLLHAKQKTGHRIVILDTTSCDPEIAFMRANQRESGRYFPKDYVFERKKIVDDLMPQYRAVADEWLVFDTYTTPLPTRVITV